MTILVAILLGTGLLLIVSAMDNTPIVSTFQKIVSGDPINWGGSTGDASLPPGTVVTQAASGCPSGWTKITSVHGVPIGGGYACTPPTGGAQKCPAGYSSINLYGVFMCVPAATTVN